MPTLTKTIDVATVTSGVRSTRKVAAKGGKETKPAWVEQLRMKFSAGVSHTFLITGNVRDLVTHRMTLDAYLAKMFLMPTEDGVQYFDMVIFYDRANGIRFPVDEMKNEFVKQIGLAAPPPQATGGVFGSQPQEDRRLPSEPIAAFAAIEKLLKSDRKTADNRLLHCVVIIDFAESLLPAGEWGRLTEQDRHCVIKVLSWAKDAKIGNHANPIILVADTPAQINDAITASASRIEQLEVLLPSPEERKIFVDYLNQSESGKQKERKETATGLHFEKGFNAQKFAHLCAGLKKMHIEDVKLTAIRMGVPISSELVKERKTQIYKNEYDSVLEIIDPEQGFEVVGDMQWLKDYLRDEIIIPMIEGDTTRCPTGILFTGASGTGKTILAMALTREAHMNMVRLGFDSFAQTILPLSGGFPRWMLSMCYRKNGEEHHPRNSRF
jgi:hypothetical protein